jgi:predicted dehydrogenase
VLDLAVVGAGIMGANHARIASKMRDVNLSHVVDTDIERGRRLARATGATFADDVTDVLDQVQAAVVATPSETHAAVARPLLQAGIGVLVEKPIAPTEGEAAAMIDLAAASGAVLMVGHVERYNPAVLELDRICQDIVHIDAARLSAYSGRIRDDVVTDLMIHDLDLVRSLVGHPVVDVAAVARTVRSSTPDLACALLGFANGATANLTASRVGQGKVRQLDITQADSVVNVDLVRMDVSITRVEHSEFLSQSGARYRQSGVVEIPYLDQRGEPLELELADFLQAVTAGRSPRVSGEDGLEAIQLVRRVLTAADREGRAGPHHRSPLAPVSPA